MRRTYRAYGFWAPAIAAYQASGIVRWAGTPELAALLKIEDPYAYRDRLTMPKFMINSAGDQYFRPFDQAEPFEILMQRCDALARRAKQEDDDACGDPFLPLSIPMA